MEEGCRSFKNVKVAVSSPDTKYIEMNSFRPCIHCNGHQICIGLSQWEFKFVMDLVTQYTQANQ